MLPEHEIELFQVRGPVRPRAIAAREIFPASEIVHPVHDSELASKVVGLVYDRGTGQQDDPLPAVIPLQNLLCWVAVDFTLWDSSMITLLNNLIVLWNSTSFSVHFSDLLIRRTKYFRRLS